MDISTVEDHLAQAERHVLQGITIIENQRRLVDEMRRDGHNTASHKALLAQFEDTQRLHVADRDRLRVELAEMRRRSRSPGSQ